MCGAVLLVIAYQFISLLFIHKSATLLKLEHLFFYSQSLLEMGTKDMDFVQLNQLIGRKTGGISVYPFTSSVRGKVDPCTRIIVRGKAMAARVEDLFNLVLLLSLAPLICSDSDSSSMNRFSSCTCFACLNEILVLLSVCRSIAFSKMFSSLTNNALGSLFPKAKQEWR